MSTVIPIVLDQGDDPYLDLTATESTGTPVNFTGSTVEMLIKASRTAADATATVLSSAGASPKITISTVTAVVDLLDQLDTPGTRWYRARVVTGGRARTFLKGPLRVDTA